MDFDREMIKGLLKRSASIGEDPPGRCEAPRGWYICGGINNLFYLHSNGDITRGVEGRADAFWPSRQEAEEFYERWKGCLGELVSKGIEKSPCIMMPKELTAENGAKAALMGEFFEHIAIDNPDYCDCGECDVCTSGDQEETYLQKVTISWTTIKAIYKKAVEHFEGSHE